MSFNFLVPITMEMFKGSKYDLYARGDIKMNTHIKIMNWKLRGKNMNDSKCSKSPLGGTIKNVTL